MKMVAEAYTEPEPHFAQILKVSEIQPAEVYPQGGKQGSERGLGQGRYRRDPQRQQASSRR